MFERNNNIRRFSFETPFTKTGKSHGSLVEQLKRKTILTSTKIFCHLFYNYAACVPFEKIYTNVSYYVIVLSRPCTNLSEKF